MLLILMLLQCKDVTKKYEEKVVMAVIKRTKTRVVVMIINTRRHPYINFMKSSINLQCY